VNNFKLLIFFFLPINFIFQSCKENDWKIIEDKKVEYKIISSFDAESNKDLIAFGDELTIHYSISTSDGNVIESSFNKNLPIKIILPTKMHRNSFEEVLCYARSGDSIIMRIKFKDARKELDKYASYFKNPDDLAIIQYKILTVFSKEQKKIDLEKIYAIENGFSSREDYLTEKKSIQEQVKENENLLLEQISKYKNRKLKTQRIKSGLEMAADISIDKAVNNSGDSIYFYYIAALDKEGKIFDNTFMGSQRSRIIIGKKNNYPALFNESILYLKKGSKTTIFANSKYGYGEKGSMPLIAPNSDLSVYIFIADIKPKLN